MAFRIAAKNEIGPYFAIFWFEDVLQGIEIDQAWSSLFLSLSLLTACADCFVASVARRAIHMDAKLQKGSTSRLGIILHRGGSGDLNSIVPSVWLPWKSLEGYVESDVCLATQRDDVSARLRRWFYEGNPVGHTGTLLREGLYGSRVGNARHIPFDLAQIELNWSECRNRKS